MKALCRNSLTIDYTCKDAISDLNESIRRAEAQRNKDELRLRSSFSYITRKW